MPQVSEFSWLYCSMFCIFLFFILFSWISEWRTFSFSFSMSNNNLFFSCF